MRVAAVRPACTWRWKTMYDDEHRQHRHHQTGEEDRQVALVALLLRQLDQALGEHDRSVVAALGV